MCSALYVCVCLTICRLHHKYWLFKQHLQMAATSPWHTWHNPFSHPVSWIQQSICWRTHAHLLHVFPYFLTFILWHRTAAGWCTPLNSGAEVCHFCATNSNKLNCKKYWVVSQKGFLNDSLIRHLPKKKKYIKIFTIAVVLVKMLKQTSNVLIAPQSLKI